MSGRDQTGVLLEHLFRREAGRIVAHLTRLLGPAHLDLAEEAVQESMLRALRTWPYQGVPEQAAAWLYRVAHNAAIDSVRRNRLAVEKADAALAELTRSACATPGDLDFEEQLRDDELRVIFMCSHPEVAPDARAALSLKIAGGFSVREIARAFLTNEATVAQRLVRAKAQIRDGRFTLELPQGRELRDRLDSVLEVIYLVFNEGYAVHEGAGLIRRELCFEALRLGQLVSASSIATPRVHALVALMALQAARLAARVDEAGDVVLLDSQNRNRWDGKLIALGFRHFDQSIAGDDVSEYHVQAAIAAAHARAAGAESTDWPLILQHYDQLLGMSGSPVVALNRAVAVAKVRGPAEGLAAIEAIQGDPKLRHYHLLLATRGHLLMELDRRREAVECFRASLECRCSEPERRFLRRKLEECEASQALPAVGAVRPHEVQWPSHPYRKEQSMELGAFSISLAVKDIEASRRFYEKFGFKVFTGDASQNWLILKNGDHAIGLFQGMFERNILTFNPGWDSNAGKLASFTDVRDLQRQLKAQGVQLQQEADESTTGPASFVAVDPDGNPILVDQHV